MAHDTRGVLVSPAMSLCELEDVGFDITVVEGRLRVAPGDRLTGSQGRDVEAEIRRREGGKTAALPFDGVRDEHHE